MATDPKDVLRTEFSEPFVDAMRNRMVVSYFKYGPVEKATGVDKLKSLEKRIALYRETGNTEWLVDAGNFAMIEYMFPSHPNAHFRGTDSRESPGRADVTGVMTKATNEEIGGGTMCPKCGSPGTEMQSGLKCTSLFCMYTWSAR